MDGKDYAKILRTYDMLYSTVTSKVESEAILSGASALYVVQSLIDYDEGTSKVLSTTELVDYVDTVRDMLEVIKVVLKEDE